MLAIIIPYYKLTFFEETLQSLSNQTDKRFKVYIGDDASPENPAKLLEKFEGCFNFTYQYFEFNLGSVSLTQQWDRCIALSENEEWLMILGDDDVLEPNVVDEFYKQYTFFENLSNVVRYSTMTINSYGVPFSEAKRQPKFEKAVTSLMRKITGTNRSSLSEYIFRKSSYAKYKFENYPLAWHSDDRAWLDFSETKNIYSINEANILIRLSELNISGREDNVDIKLEATKFFFKFLLKNKKNTFNISEFLILLLTLEIEIKKHRKLEQKEWFFLFAFYLKNINKIAFLKFIRRYLISTFKI